MKWKETLLMTVFGMLAAFVLIGIYEAKESKGSWVTEPRALQVSDVRNPAVASALTEHDSGSKLAPPSSRETEAITPDTKPGAPDPSLEPAVTLRREAPDRIETPEPVSAELVETQSQLAEAMRRIEDLENTLSLLRAGLENRPPDERQVMTDPSPSQRYAAAISQALTAADSYLSEQRYSPRVLRGVTDEIIRLYRIKDLSWSQNSKLKKSFRDLTQHKIDSVAASLDQITLEEGQREIEELSELAALRFSSGAAWLTKSQVLAIQEIVEGMKLRLTGQAPADSADIDPSPVAETG